MGGIDRREIPPTTWGYKPSTGKIPSLGTQIIVVVVVVFVVVVAVVVFLIYYKKYQKHDEYLNLLVKSISKKVGEQEFHGYKLYNDEC